MESLYFLLFIILITTIKLYQCNNNDNDNGFRINDSLAMYPLSSETRQTMLLDGIWSFRITDYSLNDTLYGFHNHWYNQSLDQINNNYYRMPVPSSFNDITEDRDIRDFVGWSWYDRKFFLPKNFDLNNNDILIRFNSINYESIIWLNGQYLMNHTGGHLPFQINITNFINKNQQNHITVACNNRLSNITIPQGRYKIKNDTRFITMMNKTFIESDFNFDFYNYAGIQRSVILYFVPKIRITDITIITDIIYNNDNDNNNHDGIIDYTISINQNNIKNYQIKIDIIDRQNNLINTTYNQYDGIIIIKNVNLWWPFTMNNDPGYLYTMVISLYDNNNEINNSNDDESLLIDRYYQKFGVRKIHIENYKFYVNNKEFYFRGFGKHEEYDIRGRSFDQVMIIKDFNLIKWIGANSFRTSHYPYSEQIMDEADIQGIAVIDECPAVSLTLFNEILLKQHLIMIKEMIERDKNRPSVFMWSIANEASSNKKESEQYFQELVKFIHKFDQSKRPITAADNQYHDDYLPQVLDVIMINRYYGWYSDNGYIQVIRNNLINDFLKLFNKYKKPLMISEYGADTIAGMHMEPSFVFTEDYQSELMIENHRAFDILRNKYEFFIGEHIWNFADFMTQQTLTRVGGNKKGIFTRQRQPKTSARLLRCRYWQLANITNDYNLKGFSYCPNVYY